MRNVWKVLPWNDGKDPDCSTKVVYCDDDFRINMDIRDSYFVYMRTGGAAPSPGDGSDAGDEATTAPGGGAAAVVDEVEMRPVGSTADE